MKDRIANIIYRNLNYMYCNNCRYNSEISKDECIETEGLWNCEDCHRKYNGWAISKAESEKLARIIMEEVTE